MEYSLKYIEYLLIRNIPIIVKSADSQNSHNCKICNFIKNVQIRVQLV